MTHLLSSTAERAINYLDNINDRPIVPESSAVKRTAGFVEEMPEEATSPNDVIQMLDELGSPATMATTGRRFFGFVVGGVYPAALAANWLASTWDQVSSYYAITPATAKIEEVALGWMVDVLGLPEECNGAFVTGGTMANFTALAAARRQVLLQAGWDVEDEGLFGAPPITVVVGEEAHSTLFKSLAMLGLGRKRVIKVPVDLQGRMRADALPEISGPTIVCTQAGNVNSGAIDPVGEICDLAQKQGAWVHVDGAFGLWAAASQSYAHLVAGVEKADSWSTDCHKWLNVPYDSGVAFVKNEDALRAAMSISAAYLPAPKEHRDPSDYTPEFSRRARGVEVWAVMKHLGRQGLAELVEGCCSHARHFRDALSAAGFKVLNDVVLNQVVVSFGDEQTTKRLIDRLQRDGTCWAGITSWRGQTAMRISVSSWATTEEDVELSLKAIINIADNVASL